MLKLVHFDDLTPLKAELLGKVLPQPEGPGRNSNFKPIDRGVTVSQNPTAIQMQYPQTLAGIPVEEKASST